MHIKLWIILILLLGAILIFPQESNSASTAYDLLAEVNALRKANGLAPYQTNPILMSIAQAHSDYQASINTVTHYSADGSRPRDRAAYAGYGGGSTFFLSENIAGGTNLTAQTAVVWWQGDAPHLNTMLGANYVEAGVGVGVSGDWVYYTLDVGYVVGTAPNPTSPAQETPLHGTPAPTDFPYEPIVVSTPAADGSIRHVVGAGQTPYWIAEKYEITLADLLKLNNLSESSVIYIGDVLIIRVAFTPTTTPDTNTPTIIPSTNTPEVTVTQSQTPSPTRIVVLSTPTSSMVSTSTGNKIPFSPWFIVYLGLGALAMAGILAYQKRRKP